MNTLRSSKPHYAVLDTIRGFAAMWVFLAHSFLPAGISRHIPVLTDGRAAVDVFMVLSGFLIFERYANCQSSLEWKKYFVARLFRICPLYYVLLVCAVALWFGGQYWSFLPWLLGRISFVFGFVPSMLEPAPLPDWSLALEMQFYLAFPLFVLLIKRYGWLPLVLLGTALSAIFYSQFTVYIVNPPGSMGNFLQPTLLPFKLSIFLLGGLIAFPGSASVATLVMLHTINLIGVLIPASLMIGFKSSVCIYVVTLFAVYGPRALHLQQSAAYLKLLAFASWKPFCFFGTISYGLYLFHPFVFDVLSHGLLKIPAMQALGIWSQYAVFLTAALAAAIPCCYLLHVVVEKPGIDLGKFLSRKLTA